MANSINYFSISPKIIIEEAIKMGLIVDIVSKNKNLFYISSNKNKILFKSTDFGGNSSLGSKICNDKQLTYIILDDYNIPISKSICLEKKDFNDFNESIIQELNFPLVIKPLSEGHGDGVLVGIKDFDELKSKLKSSFEFYENMIIQEQIIGDEVRVLVVKGRVIAAIQRVPAFVIGDGIHTISELINIENEHNSLRGDSYKKFLSKIIIDDELIEYLSKNGIGLDDIGKRGIHIQLRGTSNIGKGGIPVDVTDSVSEDIKNIAIKSTEILGLELCGVDILTSDFSKTLKEGKGAVLELNATPGIHTIGSEKIQLFIKTIFDLV